MIITNGMTATMKLRKNWRSLTSSGKIFLATPVNAANKHPERQVTLYVRFGSKADIEAPRRDVRFTPESGHRFNALGCPLSAKMRHCRTFT
jgi:hypothetical protein